MLFRSTLLSEKQVKYDHLLQSCNHLTGRELEIRKLQMKDLESEINELRGNVSHNTYKICNPTSKE